MQNTIEDKTKFFGAHIGQKIVFTGKGRALKGLGKEFILSYDNLDRLQAIVFSNQRKILLKHIANITDQDAIELGKILEYVSPEEIIDIVEHLDEIFTGNCATFCDYVSGNTVTEIVDFLRSKGYALPYNGLKVEKQIEYGWIKLEE